MTPEALELARPFAEMTAARMPHISTEWTWQHGDPSFRNSRSGFLIDFDDAGLRPQGWDRACLALSSIYEGVDRFEDVWEFSDEAKGLLPVKWAWSVTFHLVAGRLPPLWGDRDHPWSELV